MDRPADLAIYSGLKKGLSCWSVVAECKKYGINVSKSTVTHTHQKIKLIQSGQQLPPWKSRLKIGSYKYHPDQLQRLKTVASKENAPPTRSLESLTGIKRSTAQYHLKRTFGLKFVKKLRAHHLTPDQIERQRSHAKELHGILKSNWILTTD